MASFNAHSGRIEFEHRGARANPRVLLIHGLGCQLAQWPDSFVDGVVATGLCAVVFDNRDAGLSHDSDARAPSLEALFAAQDDPSAIVPPYTLSDMAQDAVDLLDHLGQAGAHIVGLSMGGMIGQRMAIEHAERVYSLTSIMSSTGNPQLPEPTSEALEALLGILAANSATAIAHIAQAWRTFAGPHFDSDEVGIGRFTRRAVARAYRPGGTLRQFSAILADGDRSAALAQVAVPTLAIHGNADPLVPVEAGRDTAAAIPGARYLEIDRLGHDLPEPAVNEIVAAVTAHIHNVEVSR